MQRFTYDPLYRLVGATGSYQFSTRRRDDYSLTVGFDRIDNIVSQRRVHELVKSSGDRDRQRQTSFSTDYAYDPARPHAAIRVGGREVSFDENGNQVRWHADSEDQRMKAVWDGEDRVRSLSVDGHSVRFAYDAEGVRAFKDGDDGAIEYVSPFYTVKNGKEATTNIVVGGTRVASRPEHGLIPRLPSAKEEIQFYHPDHLGSVNFVTDRSGTVIQHREYFPFGEVWVDERGDEDADDVPDIGFAGRPMDEETGLVYFGARYEDPRHGRFLSVDPSSAGGAEALAGANPATLNAYGYASGNPIRLVTPAGLKPGWWSKLSETFALLRGVGDPLGDDPDDVADIFRGGDSPSNGGIAGPAGNFVAAAGTGVISDFSIDSQRHVENQHKRAIRRPTANRSVRGPPKEESAPESSTSPEPTTRARSNAVVLDKRAPVVLGENMDGRVMPYARSVGAETIRDWLAGREWSQQLNDEYIRTIRSENREILDIGPDFGRRLAWKLDPSKASPFRPVYESERELLRGYDKRKQLYERHGPFGGVPGLDFPAKREGGPAGETP
jgi:RHS repeat-associated protein